MDLLEHAIEHAIVFLHRKCPAQVVKKGSRVSDTICEH
jgi:hypothetical protein